MKSQFPNELVDEKVGRNPTSRQRRLNSTVADATWWQSRASRGFMVFEKLSAISGD
jgi:hypothetical protein